MKHLVLAVLAAMSATGALWGSAGTLLCTCIFPYATGFYGHVVAGARQAWRQARAPEASRLPWGPPREPPPAPVLNEVYLQLFDANDLVTPLLGGRPTPRTITFSTDGSRMYVAYTGLDERQYLDERVDIAARRTVVIPERRIEPVPGLSHQHRIDAVVGQADRLHLGLERLDVVLGEHLVQVLVAGTPRRVASFFGTETARDDTDGTEDRHPDEERAQAPMPRSSRATSRSRGEVIGYRPGGGGDAARS